MALEPGTRVGRYQITSKLGAGGMGEVYRAHDPQLQREVAVKVLPAAMAQNPDALRRLEQEARAIAALNHPNLLSVYDVGRTEAGTPYLVTELLEGETLRQRLAAGALPQRKAVDYAAHIARGLAAAHDKGIVHRDLKPENIFCTDDGLVKILDFGLAKLAAPGDDAKTLAAGAFADAGTAAGTVLGTVGYMAPEQARGLAADARSDIFSLGAVLYEMLAGRRAFRGASAADVISAILREEPPEISSSSGSGAGAVDPALERIVRHCLEKEPKLRFQSAGDLALNLADLSHASSTQLRAAAATGPERRRGWSTGALASVGLALAVALGWFGASHRAPVAAARFQRLSFQQGYVSSLRFLPDGSVIGTARWNEAANFSPFVARPDSVGLQPLNWQADAILAVSHGQLAVLQNSRTILGWTTEGTLAIVPLGGGSPRPTVEHVEFADFSPTQGDLAITRYHGDTSTFTLEYPVGHVLYRTSGWIGDIRFSPDGRRIAFLDHLILGDDNGAVAVVDLNGKKSSLTTDFSSTQGLAWSPAGNAIWFGADSDGTNLSLYQVPLDPSRRLVAPRLVEQAPGDLHLFDARADGSLLVSSDIKRRVVKLVTAQAPQPREFSVQDWPAGAELSADGKELLVDDSEGRRYSTFLRGTDGSPPVRLGDGTEMGLSPDGQWAASSLPQSPEQIMLLPTGAGQPRQLTHSTIDFVAADWMPDSRRLLAVGIEPGARPRTYLVAADGSARAVTPAGVEGTVSTPDGSAVVAAPQDDRVYALYPLAGGAPRPIPGLKPGDLPLRFSADGHALFVSSMRPFGGELNRIDLTSGQRQKLFSLDLAGTAGVTTVSLDTISADGKSYAYIYTQMLSTIYVVAGLR